MLTSNSTKFDRIRRTHAGSILDWIGIDAGVMVMGLLQRMPRTLCRRGRSTRTSTRIRFKGDRCFPPG